MAHEISPVFDFLFGSIRPNLPTDTVHVELTVWMEKDIYTYRKYHIMESTIFTLWGKKVRCNIQAYHDNKRSESVAMK